MKLMESIVEWLKKWMKAAPREEKSNNSTSFLFENGKWRLNLISSSRSSGAPREQSSPSINSQNWLLAAVPLVFDGWNVFLLAVFAAGGGYGRWHRQWAPPKEDKREERKTWNSIKQSAKPIKSIEWVCWWSVKWNQQMNEQIDLIERRLLFRNWWSCLSCLLERWWVMGASSANGSAKKSERRQEERQWNQWRKKRKGSAVCLRRQQLVEWIWFLWIKWMKLMLRRRKKTNKRCAKLLRSAVSERKSIKLNAPLRIAGRSIDLFAFGLALPFQLSGLWALAPLCRRWTPFHLISQSNSIPSSLPSFFNCPAAQTASHSPFL